MSLEYSEEQFWKLYYKLPEELRKAMFSVELADNMYDICGRNEIDNVPRLTELTQYVLLGVLSPEDFQETVKKEMDLKEEVAKRITREVYRFVLHPLKYSLESLYEIEIATPAAGTKESRVPTEKPMEKKKPTPSKKDLYREPLE